jgi:predicted nucleotidyltransferase
MVRVKEIQIQLESLFKKEKSVVFAYVFGSVASDQSNKASDVDIAVYLDESCVKDLFEERLFLIEKIQAVLQKSTEVVVLNEIKSIFFKFVIIREGKVIFEKDHGKRMDFELKIMREYYDFQPFMEEYNKAYLKRNLKSTHD